MIKQALALVTVLLISAAQLFFKQGVGTESLLLLGIGLALLVVGFACFRKILAKSELTIIFPFLAFSYVLVALSSKFLFNEELILRQWIGIAAIVIGVSMLRRKI